MNTLFWRLGAFSAGSSIALQAYAGHKPWTLEKKNVFSKGWEIQISSALGLMLLSRLKSKKNKVKNLAGFALFLGSLIFSGILYYRCFNDDPSYNRLMPYGGGSVILGWILTALI